MDPSSDAATVLADEVTLGLGEIRLFSPPGTFPITPASLISIEGVGGHRDLLSGVGIDWGSGGGCLAIAAGKISAVDQVVGLDLAQANVEIARKNARINGVENKAAFMHADSYVPFAAADRDFMAGVKGRVSFVLANPPSSEGDDGFEFRRIVLRGARDFLSDGGVVFLSISSQYGAARVARLQQDVPGFSHEGILATTDWVPFDLGRADLLQCLEAYTAEEERGGLEYSFCHPLQPAQGLGARASLDLFKKTRRSPLSRWQVHLFRYSPSGYH